MKGIVITSDKSEVFTLYNSKNEDKIRERLKFFRGAGYSDSALCSRYHNYVRRLESSGRYYYNGGDSYCHECMIMKEVFRRLCEERGFYFEELDFSGFTVLRFHGDFSMRGMRSFILYISPARRGYCLFCEERGYLEWLNRYPKYRYPKCLRHLRS